MTRKQLLRRQDRLLHYLTSGDAIFGGRGPVDAELRGVDATLLRMEARFSYEKRMEKIAGVFSRTLDLLGNRRDLLIREFVHACPPVDITRLTNARQFHDFLSDWCSGNAAEPRYLPDVAACELACAEARAVCDDAEPAAIEVRSGAIRRRAGVMLLRCAFDVQPIFEISARHAVERDTPLAIVFAPDSDQPRISELNPAVFELLNALDGWMEAAPFRAAPEADALIADLARAGLLEVWE
jgi:hypothetical protein